VLFGADDVPEWIVVQFVTNLLTAGVSLKALPRLPALIGLALIREAFGQREQPASGKKGMAHEGPRCPGRRRSDSFLRAGWADSWRTDSRGIGRRVALA
jgi:hypothetical protein